MNARGAHQCIYFFLLLAGLKKAALFLYSCSWLATIYIYIYSVYIVYIYIHIHLQKQVEAQTALQQLFERPMEMAKHMFNPIFAW